MSKKNLILFYPSLEKGGVTFILQNLLKFLSNKNMNIHLISSENILSNLNIKKNNLYFHNIKKKNYLPFLPGRFNSAFNAMTVLNKLIKKLNKNIIVHSMQSNIAAIIVCKIQNIKIIIRNSENPIYSTLYSENKISTFLVFLMKFIFYNFADGIITNSYGSKKSLGIFVIKKKKIITIYNPYLKKLNHSKNKKENYIINIGRLRKQKDHKTLISAFKIFNNIKKNYKLIILGHGSEEKRLKTLAKKLGIDKKVIFKGWVENTIPYLKKSKFFVLSSIYEGLGNVLIDAINYDLVCISTNCPSGPGEILLNGKGGYLVKSKSPQSLAQKMIYCTNNYSKARKKNDYAKKNLSRFFMKKNLKIYFNYLNRFY